MISDVKNHLMESLGLPEEMLGEFVDSFMASFDESAAERPNTPAASFPAASSAFTAAPASVMRTRRRSRSLPAGAPGGAAASLGCSFMQETQPGAPAGRGGQASAR